MYTGPYKWQGADQGATRRKRGRETPTHLPLQPQEWRWPPVSTTPLQLSRRVSGQDQRPLGTFRKVLPALQGTGMSPRPGTWTGESAPITALGAHGESPTSLSSYWGGVHPELGVQGDHILAVRQAAVPPVPTRGLPTAAAREQAEAPVQPAGSSHLHADLGPTFLPAGSSCLSLQLPPAEFLVGGVPSTPTHGLHSPEGADHQQHTPVSSTILSLSLYR